MRQISAIGCWMRAIVRLAAVSWSNWSSLPSTRSLTTPGTLPRWQKPGMSSIDHPANQAVREYLQWPRGMNSVPRDEDPLVAMTRVTPFTPALPRLARIPELADSDGRCAGERALQRLNEPMTLEYLQSLPR